MDRLTVILGVTNLNQIPSLGPVNFDFLSVRLCKDYETTPIPANQDSLDVRIMSNSDL